MIPLQNVMWYMIYCIVHVNGLNLQVTVDCIACDGLGEGSPEKDYCL